MAEFEPYSFEPMRDLPDSEEEQAATQGKITRRGNTAWCSCDHCENWENQQERECVCCPHKVFRRFLQQHLLLAYAVFSSG